MLVLRGKTYYYRFWINGKLYQGTTQKTDKAEAVLIEKELKKKIKDEQSGEKILQALRKKLVKKTIPVNNIWDHYQNDINKGGNKQQMQTYKTYLEDLLFFIKKQHPSAKDCSEITSDIARKYIGCLKNSGKYDKTVKFVRYGKISTYQTSNTKLSKRTIKAYLTALKSIFNVILKEEGMLENPFNEIAIKRARKDKESRRAFTPEELKLIGEKGKNSYLYPLFLTGISTGMREGDICNLKWENICLKTGWIRNLKMSKTKEEINIPILPGLKSYLENIKRTKNSIYVFTQLHDTYIKNNSKISKDVTKFLESIGIESNIAVEGRSRKVSVKDIHSLRHTFAYLAAVQNIPLPIVQSILGHMTPEMTKMYIDHAEMKTKQKMLSQMPNYLHAEEIKEPISREEIRKQLLDVNEHNWEDIINSLLKALS